MAKIAVNRAPVDTIPMFDLPHGAFAEVVETYVGAIVFRSYEGDIISITPDGSVDGFSKNCPLMVRVLKSGESFTVTV